MPRENPQAGTRTVGRIVIIEGWNAYGDRIEIRTSREGGFWACQKNSRAVKLTGVEAAALCLELFNNADCLSGDLSPVIASLRKGIFSDWRIAADRVQPVG